MEYRKQAKAAMNSKISRMITPGKEKVDASDWSPSEPLNADVKTGMRPVSRRQFKRGGKVKAEDKVSGKKAVVRADRVKRKSGGPTIIDSLINRDEKQANEQREGKKHVGGMKKGGRAKKALGGLGMMMGGGGMGRSGGAPAPARSAGQRVITAPINGPAAPKPPGGGNGDGNGPGLPDNFRDHLQSSFNNYIHSMLGSNAGAVGIWNPFLGLDQQAARKSAMARKSGGKVSKEEWGHSKADLKQDKKLAKKRGMSMEAWEKSKADEKHDEQQSPEGLKKGGRAEKYVGGGMPYGGANVGIPQGEGSSMARKYLSQGFMKDGGKVDHSAHKAIGHAVGAALRAYNDHDGDEEHEGDERKERKAGGRIGKAMGGGFGEDMNNPKAKPVKSGGKGKTPVINITINSKPDLPMGGPVPGGPIPLGAPPMPPPGLPGQAPGLAGPGGPGGAPGGMPPGLMAAMAAGPGAGGPPPMPRKNGGRTNPMTAGAGSGEGRLEKKDWYGARSKRAAGGKLGMTAGSGSGEGRLQKIDAYGKKA
jgi:hypothetical protein